jgi:cold-inducible RNA-binding protein
MEPSQQTNPKKLFVGNLAYVTTEDGLREAFGAFGEIVDVKLVTEFGTGRSKGFAFVEFAEEAMAQAAIEGMNEKELDGRTIFVKVAEPRKPRENRGGGGRSFGGNRGGFSGGGDNRPNRSDRGGRSFGGGGSSYGRGRGDSSDRGSNDRSY